VELGKEKKRWLEGRPETVSAPADPPPVPLPPPEPQEPGLELRGGALQVESS
jgi:hypothetical protein